MFQFDFFRANAAAIIVNEKGQVLAFERSDTKDAWQFPQGGVNYKEDPIISVYREIKEETGIDPEQNLELIAEYPQWLVYEFPKETRPECWSRGQAQKWFLFKTKSPDVKPDLSQAESSEFINWKWAKIDEITDKMIYFKKPIYHTVTEWAKRFFPNL